MWKRGQSLLCHFATRLRGHRRTFAAVMKKKEHLPFFGIGPFYVGIVVLMTVAGMILSSRGYLDSGLISWARLPMLVLGIVMIVLGAVIYGSALFMSRIDDGIRNNRLVTDGIYAWVRNPLYVGCMFVCIGILMTAGNVWLLVLPLIFWWLMAVMMKHTEEKWLHELYGKEYDEYCRRVNRTWPWVPEKKYQK